MLTIFLSVIFTAAATLGAGWFAARRGLLPGLTAAPAQNRDDAPDPARERELEQALTAARETLEAARGESAQLRLRVAEAQKRSGQASLQLQKLREQSGIAEQELNLMRIERDALLSRIEALSGEATTRQPSTSTTGQYRSQIGSMREDLVSRESRIRELENSREQAERRVNDLEEKLENLKRRVAPMTTQLRRHKEQIHRIRTEDKRREAPASPAAPAAPAEDAANDPGTGDDLKSLKGIGPALERGLKSRGITRYEQIARLSEDDLSRLAGELRMPASAMLGKSLPEQAAQLCGDGD